jgi:DNA-binding beta-propeller fold protein YncE
VDIHYKEIMRSYITKELTLILIFIFGVTYGINSVAAEYGHTYVMTIGNNGSGIGEFNDPHSIAFDSHDYMYVTDEKNHRIQKFTNNGTFITKWGTNGSGDGEFISPEGIDVDSLGNVYVADTGNSRVQKFTNNGTFITKWGTNGSGDGNSPLTPMALQLTCQTMYM